MVLNKIYNKYIS